MCAVGGCNSRETRRVDGGISFIEACERLDSQSDTLTRETTQSPGISCGESSSESVAAPASLNSQACSLPVLPVEPHVRSKDELICATGNTVHRSSAKTRTGKNERMVATILSISTRLPISPLKCFERLPWQLWRSRNTQGHSTPLSASVTRKTVRNSPLVLALIEQRARHSSHATPPASKRSRGEIVRWRPALWPP
jgi:hypothetical protein